VAQNQAPKREKENSRHRAFLRSDKSSVERVSRDSASRKTRFTLRANPGSNALRFLGFFRRPLDVLFQTI